jgi:pantothenate kinase
VGEALDQLLDRVDEVILRSIAEVAAVVTDAAAGSHRTIVGIAGSPGAGKSTIAEALVRSIPSAALLPMDGYHLPQARLVELGRRDRMGAPDTFDVDGFLLTLRDLVVSGGPVFAPGFDRTIEEAVPDAIGIQPEHSIVIVEGNYLLHDAGGWENVAPQLDVTFFVDIDRDLRLSRLIERHVRFGKSPEAARDWALGPDETNARLIEATASRADHRIRLP